MSKLCNFWVMYRLNVLVVHTQTIHILSMTKLSTTPYITWSCVVMRGRAPSSQTRITGFGYGHGYIILYNAIVYVWPCCVTTLLTVQASMSPDGALTLSVSDVPQPSHHDV